MKNKILRYHDGATPDDVDTSHLAIQMEVVQRSPEIKTLVDQSQTVPTNDEDVQRLEQSKAMIVQCSMAFPGAKL